MKIQKLTELKLANRNILELVQLGSSNLVFFLKFSVLGFLVICALIDLLVFSRATLVKTLDSLMESCQELCQAQEIENQLVQKHFFYRLRTIYRCWQLFKVQFLIILWCCYWSLP